MSVRRQKRLVHEGDYVAEVTIDLIETDDAWSPYLSPDDAAKLDAMRKALRQENLAAANRLGKVFRLMPVAV